MKWKRTCLYKGGKFVNLDGEPNEQVRDAVRDRFKELDGQPITIELNPCGRTRSQKQNDYWFAVLDKYVVPQFREAGSNWSGYKIHKWLMLRLGYEEALTLPTGEVISVRLESHEFDTKQWEEFMERARAELATEFNIYVPIPREDDFYNH